MSNINIAPSNIEGKCELKCIYNFDYPTSTVQVENKGSLLYFLYDTSTNSPVTYNNNKYNVNNISIVSPSIHEFDGQLVAAELIVEHTPVISGPVLKVGMPLINSTNYTSATEMITNIISACASMVPAEGETAVLNGITFALNTCLPNKPFYSYTDTDNADAWIVYGSLEAIPLSDATITNIQSIIRPFVLPTPGTHLFVNSLGPNTSHVSQDGIYISCQPTGSSTDEVPVEYNKSNDTASYDIMSNKYVKDIIFLLLAILGIGILFYVINIGYNYASGEKGVVLPSVRMKRQS